MGIESLTRIVEQSLNEVDYEKLTALKGKTIREQIIALVKFASKDYVGSAETELQVMSDYKDSEFFRKYVNYLLGLTETTQEERHLFAEEIQLKAEDSAGNVIFGMVEGLDNINKQKILAQLSIAKMHKAISIEDFFRLYNLLVRIPYVDLKELVRYKEPFYDVSGDTELLFATGVLEMHTIDTKGGSNKYVLSRLGELLLRWGMGIHLELEHGKGTNVELDTLTAEAIDEVVDHKVDDARPKWEGDVLDKVTEHPLSMEYDEKDEGIIMKKRKR